VDEQTHGDDMLNFK